MVQKQAAPKAVFILDTQVDGNKKSVLLLDEVHDEILMITGNHDCATRTRDWARREAAKKPWYGSANYLAEKEDNQDGTLNNEFIIHYVVL